MPFEFAFLDWLYQFRNPVMNTISIFFDYAGAHGEIWIAFTLLLLLFRHTRKAGFAMAVALVLYTCGSKGARAYTRTASAHARSPKVTAVDTTGAGDGFIGSFLWQLQRDGVTTAELPKLSRKRLTEYLTFSNRFCAFSVQHHGAIDSYPTLAQMEQPETDFPLP